MTQTVSFEIAKLLKEKKQFVIDGGNYYSEKGDLRFCQSGSLAASYCRLEKHLECFAPTIAGVVMWFLEKNKFWISVETIGGEWYFLISRHETGFETESIYESFGMLNDVNEAYESAIKYALNNLIK